MRQTLVVFLFCLIPSLVNAQAFQYMHPALCDRLETVLDSLTNKYSEKLQWSGKDLQDGSGYMMFENPKAKTWTLIKFNKEYACILGVGGDSKFTIGESI